MRYLILGRGDTNVDGWATTQGTARIAVPAGTTIDLYDDRGQGVVYSPTGMELWGQLEGPSPLPDAQGMVDNLALYGDQALDGDRLAARLAADGCVLIRPGTDGMPDPIRLCTGAAGQCPTTPEEAAAGRTHLCEGALAMFAGLELGWATSAVFYAVDWPLSEATGSEGSEDDASGSGSPWSGYRSSGSAGDHVERGDGSCSDTTSGSSSDPALSEWTGSEPVHVAGSGDDADLPGYGHGDDADSTAEAYDGYADWPSPHSNDAQRTSS